MTPGEIRTLMLQKQETFLEREIKKSIAHTTRASQIGHPCNRFIYYERTSPQFAPDHDTTLQAIFDLGRALQNYVERRLEDMGFEITQKERDYDDRTYDVSGHVDFRIRLNGESKDFPVEAKGLNQYAVDAIEDVNDIRYHRSLHVQRYYAQIQTYLKFGGDDFGFFVLLNKTTGKLKFIEVVRDNDYINELLTRAISIRESVRAKTEPDRNIGLWCDKCPYQKTVCLPDRDFGPGVEIMDDAEIISLIDKRIALAPVLSEAKRAMENIDEELKIRLPKAPEVLVGDFIVKGTEKHRDGYQVKATSWFERRYQKVK